MSDRLRLSIRIDADGSVAVEEIERVGDASRRAGDDVERFGRRASGARGELGGLASTLGSVAGAFAGFLAVDAMADSFMQANVEAGRLRASLETVTGSVAGARDAWKTLSEFAAQTPYDLQQSVEGFIQLKALGLDPSIEALRSYGNTASAMGKDLSQMIEAVADASAGEFERLKEFGITSEQQGEQVALTFQGVTTTIKQSSEEIQAYLRQIGDVNFAGAMERQMATLGGAVADVQQKWTEFWIAIGDAGATEFVADALRGVAQAIGEVSGWVSGDMKDDLGGWFETFSDIGAAAADLARWLAEIPNPLQSVYDLLPGIEGQATIWGQMTENVGFFADAILNLPDNVRSMAYIVAAEVENLVGWLGASWDQVLAAAELVWAQITAAIGAAWADIRAMVAAGVQWIAEKLASLTGDMAAFAAKAADLPLAGDWAASLSEGLGALEQRFAAAADAASDSQAALEGHKQALQANVEAARANVTAAEAGAQAAAQEAQARRDLAVEMMNSHAQRREAEAAARESAKALTDQTADLAEKTQAGAGASEDLADGLGGVGRASGGAARGVKSVGDEAAKAAKAIADQASGIDALIKRYLPLRAAAEEYAEAERTVAAALALKNVNAEEARTILDGLKGDYDAAVAEAGAFADEWGELWKSAAGAVDNAWTGMWQNLLSGTGDTLDQLKASIKSWLADLAAMFSKRLVLNIVASFTGGGNMSLGGIGSLGGDMLGSLFGGGGTGGGFGGGFGMAGNLIGWGSTASGLAYGTGFGTQQSMMLAEQGWGMGIPGGTWMTAGAGLLGGIGGSLLGNALFGGQGYGSIGSSIGSSVGAAVGMALIHVLGPLGPLLGGLLGGTGGGWVGSLFGDKTPDPGAYSTSFSGTAGLEDGVGVAGAFGLTFGMSDKGGKNVDAEQWRPAFEGMAQVSNMLANFYGPELSEKIKASLQEAAAQNWEGDGIMRFAGGFNEAFDLLFTDILNHAAASGEDAAVALKYAIGDLWGPAEHMTMQLEGGIVAVTAAAQLMDTELGDALGFTQGLPDASRQIYEWGLMTLQSGESIAQAVGRVVAELGLFEQAMVTTGQSIADLDVQTILDASAALVDAAGGLEQLAAMQNFYYQQFFTEEERAAAQREAAQRQIEAFNETLGLTGDAAIDTRAEFRAYIESLDLTTEAGRAAWVEAMKYAEAIAFLDQTMATAAQSVEDLTQATIDGFVDSIKPDGVKEEEAFREMEGIFASWGMTIPRTSEALYELIQAGAFTDEQLLILAEHSEELGLAWSYLARMQQQAFEELEAAAREAIAAAREASAARIAALREESAATIAALQAESNARIEALNAAYRAQVAALNKQMEEAREQVQLFSAVVDATASALRSLRAEADGIDETRQRSLEEARAALEEFYATGRLPDDINEIIGGLSSVDPNDFATREEWLAAIAENEAVIAELNAIAKAQVTEGEAQIQALEAQMEQARVQHEAAIAAEKANLDRLIAAEKERLAEAIAAEEAALAETIAQIEAKLEEDKAAYLARWDESDELQVRQLSTLESILAAMHGDPQDERGGIQPVEGVPKPPEITTDGILTAITKALREVAPPVPVQEVVDGLLRAITKDDQGEAGNPVHARDDTAAGIMAETLSAVQAQTQAQVDGAAFAADQRVRWADAQADWHRAGLAALAAMERAAGHAIREQTYELSAALRSTMGDASGNTSRIVSAIQSGASEIVGELQDVEAAVRAVGGGSTGGQSVTLPGFAAGGYHTGGLRIVGERGPELELTGPSYISPNDTMSGIMRGGQVDVVKELSKLRSEVRDLQAILRNVANNTATSTKIHRRWDGEGLPPDRMDYAQAIASNTAP